MLIEKIKGRTATIGVIGLGYVGLPALYAFHQAGFNVIGFDIDTKKIEALRAGNSYLSHFPAENVKLMVSTNRFTVTSDFNFLNKIDVIIVCVPTPLTRHREPDLRYVLGTAETIAKHIRRGQLVVLESTSYPGTTDDDFRPILEVSGLKTGIDFNLAYSPEREDPNNREFNSQNTPRVVGGYTKECLTAAEALYQSITNKTVAVSSTRTAEAAKLLENIFRSINLAMVNELKILFSRMGIDIWEVIGAASTKPFGFMPFYPGPGLGGHCIPVDPYYLTWKAREYDFITRFIELAGEINTAMPYYVVNTTISALGRNGKAINNAHVLILGIAYKKDVNDTRESPSLKLIELFGNQGAHIDYNDPYIPTIPPLRKYQYDMASVPLSPEKLASYDAVVIATDHSAYDYETIYRHAQLIIDTRNAMKARLNDPKVVKA